MARRRGDGVMVRSGISTLPVSLSYLFLLLSVRRVL